ncbi:MAG: hypothetical protein U0263_22070 [Polyangiaceae bacterium]
MEDKQKSKALELAIASVEKEFGKGAIMRLKDGETIGGDVTVVPTGSLGSRRRARHRGLPRGRIIEIFSTRIHGKTTLTLHAIANVQKWSRSLHRRRARPRHQLRQEARREDRRSS